MNEDQRTAWTVRLVKAAGVREAADLLTGEDLIFDADHDNALVVARLIEIAERWETPND